MPPSPALQFSFRTLHPRRFLIRMHLVQACSSSLKNSHQVQRHLKPNPNTEEKALEHGFVNFQKIRRANIFVWPLLRVLFSTVYAPFRPSPALQFSFKTRHPRRFLIRMHPVQACSSSLESASSPKTSKTKFKYRGKGTRTWIHKFPKK